MNKKKVIKTILIILLSLVVVFVAIAVSIFQFVIKPNTKVITDAVEQIITDEEFIEEFEIETLPEDLTEDITAELNEELTDDLIEEIPKDLVPEKKKTEDKKETPKPAKPKEEYKSTYDYIKENVESSDLKTGFSYASRIDVSYVLGLLKGGLTVPEKRELKAYLKARFSNAEINNGISLYNKYSYLLK